MSHSLKALIGEIDQIATFISRQGAGTAKPWMGAEVIICEKAPKATANSWQPDKRYVETIYVGQLSWLFNKLKEVFSQLDGYGHIWKEEFYGRLGNVAVKYHAVVNDASVSQLLDSVLHEAYAMAEEIFDYGSILALPITSGNQILDDIVGFSDLSAYLSQEETYEFLKDIGLA